AKFDRFLANLSLAITEEGYGITRGLTVIDIPIGATAEFTAEEGSGDPDEGQGDGDQ
ncbi:hypothetical protein I6F34_41060, partial [Bradyrhizobium sp. BRP05]|nr:hypothetical protein [Bradyrhizobium sp. BRP05]